MPGEAPAPDQPPGSWRSNWGPLVFVWGIWAALSFWMVTFVATFGVDFPYYDEWEMIPTLVGANPITLGWLWWQHNEHRIMIPRLVYLAVEKLARYDFRGGMYFDALALSASAAALIVVARRARGYTKYTDAFLVLALLNLGQAQNLVNSFQVAFISGTLLSVAVISLSAQLRMEFRGAVALGICTAMMPLLGGHGLALVPALSLAVVFTGWGLRRAPGGTWKMLVVWAFAALAVGLMGFYFVGYERPARHPLSHDMHQVLDGAMQFLTVGLGSAVRFLWPETQVVLLLVLSASIVALIWVALKRPDQRDSAIRLLMFLGAMVSLSLGISRARAAIGKDALFASRYAALAAPFWCGVYFVWELVHDRRIRRFAQTALLFFAAVLTLANAQDGAREAVWFRDVRQVVVNDVKAGVPLDKLVAKHYGRMFFGGKEILIERIRLLHARKIGVFEQLKE
jgi:hypothetical protein